MFQFKKIFLGFRALVFVGLIWALNSFQALRADFKAPSENLGSYVFADTQVVVSFLRGLDDEVEIQIRTPDGREEQIFKGKIKEIGLNSHSSVFSGGGQKSFGSPNRRRNANRAIEPVMLGNLKVSPHRSKDFTFAVTEDNQGLVITNRGVLLTHPRFPEELESAKVRSLEKNLDLLYLLSFSAGSISGTYFFEKSSGRLIGVSPQFFKDEQMAEVAIDFERMLLYVPGGRDLDLLKLDVEALFEPKAARAVIGHSGNRTDAMGYLLDLLPDLRDSYDSKNPIRLTEKDRAIVDKVFEAFKRKDSKSVVLLGQSGTGKTTLLQALIEKLPETWEILEVPREVFEQGASLVGEIDKRVNALVQASLAHPLILIFDEFHSLKGLGTHQHSSVDLMQMLKKHIASGDMMIVATDTPEEYQRAYGSDPGLRRRFTEIRIEEPRGDELFEKLHAWSDAKLGYSIESSLMRRIVSVSTDFDMGSHEPARSIRLMEQIQTDLERAKRKEITTDDIDQAAWNLYGVGPQKPAEFVKANEEARAELLERVVDQPDLVNSMVDLWREVAMGMSQKKHRSILVVGPTGAGKTYAGHTFAKYVLKDPERFLEIDATKYRNGNFDSLIGMARYHSESPQGLLPEFLRGRGKGRNVILINEIEKAHPDLIKILMEMLDTGKLQGGDGQTYYLGRSLIVFTSNRGSEEIFPPTQGDSLRRDELAKRLESFTDKKVRELFLKASADNLYDTYHVWGSAELQRIDRAVAVLPPSFEGVVSIVKTYAQQMTDQMKEKYFYSLEIDDSIAEEIVRVYYSPAEGVRFVLQQTGNLLNRLHQEALLEIQVKEGFELKAQWSHRDEAGQAFIKIQNQKPKKEMIVQGLLASSQASNPLLDSASISRLQGLEDELKRFVFGQDEAVRLVARAVRTRALNAKMNVPGHALLLGSTGIGKTEMGRALAQVLYGSKHRIKQFGLGQVKNEHDWANIFGAARGVVGSEKMSPFEKALHEFPEGLVIILDEIGNMGADPMVPSSATPRSELLKRLYDMFEEGLWTSALGKTYDLRKHFILMTSNEGQEFFENLPNDDLRLAEWERINRRDFLQDLLREHGWPEPLLGRIGSNIALMKPLIREEQMKVAQKELGRVFEQLRSAYDFEKIKVADGFYERLSESFFSHSRGGRSLREVAENAVVDLVGQVLIENSLQREKLSDAEMILDVDDSFAGRFVRSSKDRSKREVILRLKLIFKDSSEHDYEMNITREAKPKDLPDLKFSLITAYHEAGHAVANQPELTGDRIGFITIRGDGNYGGYVRYESDERLRTLDRENVIARIARVLAGQIAQELAGFPKDSGWSSDLRQARRIAELAVTQWGLSEEALKFPVADGSVVTQNPGVQKEISLLVEAGRLEAERILKDRWVFVRLIATALMQKGHLEASDFLNWQARSRDKESDIHNKLVGQSIIPKRWRCASFLQNLAPPSSASSPSPSPSP